MGDMADWTLEQADWDDDCEYESESYQQWTTKSGEIIPVNKMSDHHLLNATNFCRRKGREDWVEVLTEEWNRRKIARSVPSAPRDPVADAFMAGWSAGWRAAEDEAYPDVGVGFHHDKQADWKEYQKSRCTKS